jgi:hypothetical protein
MKVFASHPCFYYCLVYDVYPELFAEMVRTPFFSEAYFF